MSAALVIARWCWPRGDWRESESCPGDIIRWGAGGKEPRDWWLHSRDSVASAERILIERGHAEAYGRALAVDLLPPERAPIAGMTIQWIGWSLSGELIVKIATAPLDARVYAMAAVIEKLEKNT